MIRKVLFVVVMTLCVESGADRLTAGEADDYRRKAEAAQQESHALLKQGRNDEAEHLQQVAHKLLHAAEEIDQKSRSADAHADHAKLVEAHRRLGQQLGDLLAQERKLRESKAGEGDLAHVREQIATTERELKNVLSLHGEPKHEKSEHADSKELAGIKRRIHHLRAAAENLEKADMPEMARQLYERAENMQREATRAQERFRVEASLSLGKQPKHEKKQDALHHLQEQIEQLRAEVKSLREAIGKH